MAALILLLVTFFSNNILAEILKMEGDTHDFILNRTADDVCLISRWIGEEKQLLWNSSQHHNSSLQTEASYTTDRLKVSDSGQYQEQCWTQNNVTHERNSTLLVCDRRKIRIEDLNPYVGQTLELNCGGPNQSVQWALPQYNHRTRNYELVIIDDETSSMYKLQQVKNKPSLLVTFGVSSGQFNYYCLEKNHQGCEVLEEFYGFIQLNHIQRSVGESLELNCSDFSGNKPHEWVIISVMKNEVSHNYTLMIPSLTLNHTGYYTCDRSGQYDKYYLYVCPESDPPAVVFFTGGESVTLRCDCIQTYEIRWFMKTNRTEGRTSRVLNQGHEYRVYHSDPSLVITNISLEDSGEFWCVIMEDRRCAFTSKTLVMFGEPEVDHHLVRSVLLSVVIFMMCVVVVVVVVVVWRSRSREQLPAPVEEVEMLDLSPASADVQPETL